MWLETEEKLTVKVATNSGVESQCTVSALFSFRQAHARISARIPATLTETFRVFLQYIKLNDTNNALKQTTKKCIFLKISRL
jgi:hypothetical protein